jgi:prevent-host-death family protein
LFYKWDEGIDMTREVSLREANQRFSRYIREVAAGEEIIITRRGEPVARIVPVRPKVRSLTAEQEAALARTRARAMEGWTMGGEPFDRADLHER